MEGLIFIALFYLFPVLTVAFFGFSLFYYCSAWVKNNKAPGTVSPADVKKRLILLVVASIAMLTLNIVAFGLVALIYMAVAFM